MTKIREEYSLSLQYFRENLLKIFLICIVSFILLSILFSIILSNYDHIPGLPEGGGSHSSTGKSLAERIVSKFSENVESRGISKNGEIDPIALFFNNFQACFFQFAYGILPFVFLPILSLLGNTILISAVISLNFAAGGNIPKLIGLGLLPHGIFELPAMFLSLAMGIQLCLNISKKILKKERRLSIKDILSESVRLFILFILPLLICAAVIETYVTPKLIQMI